MLELFYRDFISLKSLQVKTKKNTNYEFVVLNNALNQYDKLVKEYKKVHEGEPKDDKIYGQKQKYNSKILKALDYQPVQLQTKLLSDENR